MICKHPDEACVNMTFYGGKIYCDNQYGFCHLHDDPPPMTNADRIRGMSDEELVVFLDGFSGRCLDCAEDTENERCPIYKEGHYCRPQDIMDWLQQPAEEGTI